MNYLDLGRICQRIVGGATVMGLLGLPPVPLSAQSVTAKEGAEITYQAKRLVGELENYLNTISNADLGETDIREIIDNSYGDPVNKIFLDDKVIVEDDVDPTGGPGNRKDFEVSKYLRNFDLMYTKSSENSVTFRDVTTSPLKKKEYFYIKVYFEVLFANSHRQQPAAYAPRKRVATVRADQEGKKWKTNLVGIRFYTPEDARTVNLNNVQFAKDVSAATPSRAGGTAQPSEAAMQLLYEEERKTRESEYGQALALAREAEARQDYPAALDQYKVARELSRRLEVVKKVIEMERIIQRRNDWPLLRKQGDLAAQRRDYSQAVDLYNQVLRIKPDQTDLLNAIKELTQRIEAVSLVKNLYEQKKYDEALRECGRRLKKENDKRTYPELLLLRGRCYVASGRDKEALEAYTDVIGHVPDYLEARLARAELYERKADWAGAVAEYEVILQSIAPNDPALYARKAALQARANNPQAALEDYKKAIRLEATNPSHHYERGLVYLAQGDLAQARLDFDTAIRLDPAHARAYYGRAKAHLRANHLPEAAKDLEKARQSRLDPVSQDEVRRTSEQHYRDGLAHHEQKRFEEAIRQFDHALLLRPDYAEAWLAKGRAYSESNHYAAAKESHTQALAHRTTYAEAHYRRGLAELQLREYAPALADFQRAATLQPDYVDALINGGRTQIYLKDFAGAVATFQQVVLLLHKQARNAPRNAQAGFAAQLAETHLLLGRCHYETKNYPEAIKAFKAALDYNTNLSQAYYNRGMAHYEMNNAWEAIEDFSACLDKAPKQYEALYARAKAYELANRYERAVADYSNLLAKAESAAFQDAGYRRGASYAKQQNYVLALKDYEAYAKKYPREINDSINAEMGFLYLDAYQTSLALEKFERARAADSRNVPAMYGLAFAYAQASKIEQSVEWLRKALKADPTGWKGLKKETYLTNLRRNYFFLQLKKEYRLQ